MVLRRVALGLALAALPVQAAWAVTEIDVQARWGGSGAESASLSSTAPVISGQAYDSKDSGSASTQLGGLSSCGAPALCGATRPGSGAALARAGANGAEGVLRARAATLGSTTHDETAAFSGARAFAALVDSLTFNGSTQIGVDLDFDLFADDGGTASLVFRVTTPAYDFTDGIRIVPLTLAEFSAFRFNPEDGPLESGFSLSTWSGLGGGLQEVASDDFVPNGYQFSFLAPATSLTFLPIPGFPPPSGPVELTFELEAFSDIQLDNSAWVRADNSVHLHIEDYVSANGYAYPGRAGAGAIPEPQAWALMIAGFGLTGAMLRRVRPRRAPPIARTTLAIVLPVPMSGI